MAKKPATVLSMILSFALLAAFMIVFEHLWAGPTVSIEVIAIITAAVLAPGVLLAIFRQIRLRRAMRRKSAS